MSSFGKTLRDAREAKGLTCSQVAAQTHMLVQTVEEMEREDFHRIPAPIYGRGFVRLFAECVGLDPIPLVREFMDIYEGRRAPTVNIREVPTGPEPPPPPPAPAPEPEPIHVPEPEPIPEPPPAPAPEPEPIHVPEPEPISEPPPAPAPEPEPIHVPEPEPIPEPPPPAPAPEPEPIPEPAPTPIPEPPPVVRGLELFEHSAQQQTVATKPQEAPQQPEKPSPMPPPIDFDSSPYLTPSTYDEGGPTAAERFRKGLTNISSGVLDTFHRIPRRVWRTSALLVLAMAVIIFIILSIVKLYEATSTPAQLPTKTPTAPVEVKPAAPAQVKPAAPAKPKAAPTTKPARPAAKKAPPKPGKLKSTKQPIPDIFAD